MGIHRPVKTIWSREESIIGHHKRHAYTIYSKWGASKEGKILAAEVKLIADAGAYAYTSTKVQGNATLMCTGPYVIPNVKVDSYTVYTNNVPGGAFRGFGGPQAAYSAEMQINKLAEKLNLDPVEIRMKNIVCTRSFQSRHAALSSFRSSGRLTVCMRFSQRRTGKKSALNDFQRLDFPKNKIQIISFPWLEGFEVGKGEVVA